MNTNLLSLALIASIATLISWPQATHAQQPLLSFPQDQWILDIPQDSEFGWDRGHPHKQHLGIDTAGVAGDPVYSIGDGIVRHIGVHDRYGTVVLVEHTFDGIEPFVSLYGHLRTTSDMPPVGTRVQRREYIGQLGSEGAENGFWPEHLHFAIRKGAFIPTTRGWSYWGMGTRQELQNWEDPEPFINRYLAPDGDPANEIGFSIIGGPGGPTVTQSYKNNTVTQQPRRLHNGSFMAFPRAAQSGGDITLGDVTGDGNLELIVSAGPGQAPAVRVFERQRLRRLFEFEAYPNTIRNGVFVTTADLDGDGVDEIVTGTGPGGGPHVKAFSLKNGTPNLIHQAFPFDASSRTGVDVGSGDIDRDGKEEIIIGSGPGMPPTIRFLDHTFTLMQDAGAPREITPYLPSFRGGIRVDAGDIDDDGRDELLTGPRAGGGPHLRAFEYDGTAMGIHFFPFHPDFRGGIDVASTNWDNNGKDEILVSQASRGQAWVKVYRYNKGQTILGEFNALGNSEQGANIAGR